MKRFFIISLLIVVLDQITKFLFTNKHFLFINYTENTGAAFSILQGFNSLLIFITALIAIFIFILAISFRKIEIPLAFIFGGTLGNLIDRLFFGYVRDFIDLEVWPIFNIADSFNVMGVIIIAYFILKEKV